MMIVMIWLYFIIVMITDGDNHDDEPYDSDDDDYEVYDIMTLSTSYCIAVYGSSFLSSSSTAVQRQETMPGAFSMLGFYGDQLPTNPMKEGTIVMASTRHQKVHHRIDETPRAASSMMKDEGSFAVLTDLGTICGDYVGETKYAGNIPMSEDDIMLLSRDSHGFEKLLRAMAQEKIYWFLLFFQSYGPTWGHESPNEDELYTHG